MTGVSEHDRVLHVRTAVTTTTITDEFRRRVRSDEWIDRIRYEMMMRLAVDVLSDHVLTDATDLPCTGTVDTRTLPTSVLVELPRPWWARLLRRQPRRVWCPVVGSAGIHDAPDQLEVRGRVRVQADYFREFPEPVIDYPTGLGAVRVRTTHVPGDVRWTSPGKEH